ncbi:MAG: hypothetical protein ACE5E6_01495 [Phycisphaerae bacterium]
MARSGLCVPGAVAACAVGACAWSGCGAMPVDTTDMVSSDEPQAAGSGVLEPDVPDPDPPVPDAPPPHPDPAVTEQLRVACAPLSDAQILNLEATVQSGLNAGSTVAESVDVAVGACNPSAWPQCTTCASGLAEFFSDN